MFNIKKYFSKKLMRAFIKQRTLETINRGIEELGIKVSKKGLNNKRMAILMFVLYNIELPLPIRFVKMFITGYLINVVNELIDNLIELMKKNKIK